MKHYWTRLLPSHPKTIVYMLQSSEYDLANYFSWLNRTDDFRKVIKRKQLDYTKKAVLLLGFIWLFYIAYILFVVMNFFGHPTNFKLAMSTIALLLLPVFSEYVVIVPLWLGQNLIQKPKQRKMIEVASEIIKKSSALKIAVAGSYGKTTAKEILSTVLGEGKKVAFTPGNMNTMIGISRFAKKLDKPDVIIFELGEEKVGDVKELCNLTKPDMGIITGINEAHLSSFKTLDNTVATIFELQDYLGDKTLYKNLESELVAGRVKKSDNLVFNRHGLNGWKVSGVKIDIHGMIFEVNKGKKKIHAKTGLLGEHNIGILLVAIDIADKLGLTVKQIETGISKTVPFEHRMQPKSFNGAWILDDTYNGNSEGVKAGLHLLKQLKATRKIYVTPGLVEQGTKTEEVHEKIGMQIAEVADVVILMNNSVTKYIKKGLKKAKYTGDLKIVDDPLEFYSNIDQFIASGDLVLMQNDWTDNYL